MSPIQEGDPQQFELLPKTHCKTQMAANLLVTHSSMAGTRNSTEAFMITRSRRIHEEPKAEALLGGKALWVLQNFGPDEAYFSSL
jgi:hypothetical protein